MMAELVTFVGLDVNDDPLDYVGVEVFDGDGRVISYRQFGPYHPGEPNALVELEPGTYSAFVRTGGHIFGYPETFIVVAGDGPDPDNALIVEFTSTGSSLEVPADSNLPAAIFGWIDQRYGAADPARYQGGPGWVQKGRAGGIQYSDPVIVVTRKGSRRDGEVRQVAQGESSRASVDENGYFELQLYPNTLYSISVPGALNGRYFVSPAAGARANVESLILSSLSDSPYELAR